MRFTHRRPIDVTGALISLEQRGVIPPDSTATEQPSAQPHLPPSLPPPSLPPSLPHYRHSIPPSTPDLTLTSL
ncbi:hypothetical protein DPMN_073293 [Dreissena polymorpha]|uniref:Uncharacterized protein n=1 Tax=Dreissena polymorpha TaxID=45954 RepID=A0A9D4HAQ3_DREPO|nr:hypothetical protein DPMN_073293 [Dreissena polymorpha]